MRAKHAKLYGLVLCSYKKNWPCVCACVYWMKDTQPLSCFSWPLSASHGWAAIVWDGRPCRACTVHSVHCSKWLGGRGWVEEPGTGSSIEKKINSKKKKKKHVWKFCKYYERTFLHTNRNTKCLLLLFLNVVFQLQNQWGGSKNDIFCIQVLNIENIYFREGSALLPRNVFVKKQITNCSFRNRLLFLVHRLTFTVTATQQLEVLIIDMYYVLKNVWFTT